MGAPQGHSLLAPNIKGLTLLTQPLKLVAELDSYYLVLRYPDAEDGISKDYLTRNIHFNTPPPHIISHALHHRPYLWSC